jgi:hypothetical protein
MSDKRVFSFTPEQVKINPETGDLQTDKANAMDYILLGALHGNVHKKVFYTPSTNQYWIDEGKECPKEKLEKEFLPFLHWDFDQLIEESTEVINEKGESSTYRTGRRVNAFPPSPENIIKKRKELIEAIINEGGMPNQKDILAKTNPRYMDHPQALTDLLSVHSNLYETQARKILGLAHTK